MKVWVARLLHIVLLTATCSAVQPAELNLPQQQLGNCVFGAGGQQLVAIRQLDSAPAVLLEWTSEQGSREIEISAGVELLGFPSPPEVSIACAAGSFALRYAVSVGNAHQILLDQFERLPDGSFVYVGRWLIQADRQGFDVYGARWAEPRPLALYESMTSAKPALALVLSSAMLEAFERTGRLPADVPTDLLQEALESGLLSTELTQQQRLALSRELRREHR